MTVRHESAEHPDYRAVLKSIPPAERRGLQLTNRHGLIKQLHLGLILLLAMINGLAEGWVSLAAMIGQGAAMCFLFAMRGQPRHGVQIEMAQYGGCLAGGNAALYRAEMVQIFP